MGTYSIEFNKPIAIFRIPETLSKYGFLRDFSVRTEEHGRTVNLDIDNIQASFRVERVYAFIHFCAGQDRNQSAQEHQQVFRFHNIEVFSMFLTSTKLIKSLIQAIADNQLNLFQRALNYLTNPILLTISRTSFSLLRFAFWERNIRMVGAGGGGKAPPPGSYRSCRQRALRPRAP